MEAHRCSAPRARRRPCEAAWIFLCAGETGPLHTAALCPLAPAAGPAVTMGGFLATLQHVNGYTRERRAAALNAGLDSAQWLGPRGSTATFKNVQVGVRCTCFQPAAAALRMRWRAYAVRVARPHSCLGNTPPCVPWQHTNTRQHNTTQKIRPSQGFEIAGYFWPVEQPKGIILIVHSQGVNSQLSHRAVYVASAQPAQCRRRIVWCKLNTRTRTQTPH